LRIYKILPRGEWQAAQEVGLFKGSPVDLADGFIHFSTRAQLQETAARHFRHARDLVVLALEAEELGETLRWEPSRGGQLFPHLYGHFETSLVRGVYEAPLGPGGVPLVSA
jgi:uncharacterized protein (DUF952 family)